MKNSESINLKIKKGYDLPIIRASEDTSTSPDTCLPKFIAIYPDDFEGFSPKVDVKPGKKIKGGDPLLHHKDDENIKLVSPVGGTVTEVVRGERRHIIRVVVQADYSAPKRTFEIPSVKSGEQSIKRLLSESGLLVMIRRRPYDIIPSENDKPRDIFVTAFDSAPLAATRVWNEDDKKALKAGAEYLSCLTSGKIYLSHRENTDYSFLNEFITDVIVAGPHPAGLPGVQAANIAPVSKGECVWTLTAETMWRIGRLVLTGTVESSAQVRITGSEVIKSSTVKTVIGAAVKDLLKGLVTSGDYTNIRVISGNVLSGKKINPIGGFLRYPYSQVTVIPEITVKDEFLGWASLSPAKMSVNPSFPGKWFRKQFRMDARINGGRRAMIMSGQYDKVVPMDILTEYLVKAIISRDIENMEKLGIYEIAPEDVALAEVLDSSKLPLQQIVREGLDFLRKELE